MKDKEQKTIEAIIAAGKTMTIATASTDGKPGCAVVLYAEKQRYIFLHTQRE